MPVPPVDAPQRSATPPHKRRKTQLACTPCRARKTGCDGRRPHCTSCISRGWQDRCGYQDKVSASPALALLDLEKRLKRLEGGDKTPWEPPLSLLSDAPAPPRAERSSEAIDGAIKAAASDSNVQRLPTRSARQQPNADEDGAIYGASSISVFVNDVTSAAAGSGAVRQDFLQEFGDAEKSGVFPGYLGLPASKPSAPAWDLRDMVLPPRGIADSLIQSYWDLIHPLSPVLHQPSFLATANSLWDPPKSGAAGMTSVTRERIIFYATFNMVLALGCQRNEALDLLERENLENEFYSRSQRLVSAETIDKYSLSLVQLLVLRGIWLLYSPFAERSWATVSLAVRVAQAIGLDSAKLIAQRTSQFVREMRRRVWYSCVMIDRLASNTFGRPLLLPEETSVPLFAEIDDEYLREDGVDEPWLPEADLLAKEGWQPPNRPSRLTFFRLSLSLFHIADQAKALQDEHSRSGQSQYSAAELGTAIDICCALDAFERAVPPHLRDTSHGSTVDYQSPPCFLLQKRVLKARVKYMRLWMSRPFLLKEVTRVVPPFEAQSNNQLLDMSNTHRRLTEELCRACIQTAHDVLLELQTALSARLRTSPWHALFFAFAAGSVLVAATLRPEFDVKLESGLGKESWDRVINIFQFHSGHMPHADKGIEMLERFRKFITKQSDVHGALHEPVPGFVDHEQAGRSVTTNNSATGSTMVGEETLREDTQLPWDFDIDPTSLDLSWFTSQEMVFDDWFTTIDG